MSLRLGSAVLTVLLGGGAALAEDVWTEPYPGVRHLERATSNQKLHAVTVDLGRPELRVRATRRGERGTTVSRFAAEQGCQIAVNGDFFDSGFAPEGLAMGDGERWTGSSDGPRWGFVATGEGNRLAITLPELVAEPEPWMRDVVGGTPLLVEEGAPAPAVECASSFCNRNPRTAAGVTRDGRGLILAVVDGRRTGAAGMSLRELAALMIELGAWRALNLDGGGSSALYIEAEGGVVNQPSDGRERGVANHLGVIVGPSLAVDAGPSPPDAATPSPDAAAAALDEEQLVSGCAVTGAPPSLSWLLLIVLLPRRRP